MSTPDIGKAYGKELISSKIYSRSDVACSLSMYCTGVHGGPTIIESVDPISRDGLDVTYT